ncbi:Sec7 guanine-nucleotide-exchange factor, partial [Helicosporidium sp. ATCC 50920]
LEAGAEDGPAPSGGLSSPSRPPSQALAGSGSAADVVQSWKAFKTAFEAGLAKFAKKPAAGVEFLQAKGLLGRQPAEVAAFFRKTKGLDKTKLGEYLGERDEGHVRVMHAYVDSMEFDGLDFDEAIRRFLDGFRLPGEAQKIDRLMEKFAERYVHCNPGAFGSADAAYVLAYSVILLNTDAHNPGVKHKMSKADFLRNNRGVNDGADLDEAFLGAVYDRIVHNEIKMRDDGWQPSAKGPQPAKEQPGSASWLDALAALLPGR